MFIRQWFQPKQKPPKEKLTTFPNFVPTETEGDFEPNDTCKVKEGSVKLEPCKHLFCDLCLNDEFKGDNVVCPLCQQRSLDRGNKDCIETEEISPDDVSFELEEELPQKFERQMVLVPMMIPLDTSISTATISTANPSIGHKRSHTLSRLQSLQPYETISLNASLPRLQSHARSHSFNK